VDDASFDEFVAGSSARLFTMARLLSGGHRAEAEDLLQGAYERAYRRWRRISRRGDPERYVRQMLVNASVDRWRRLRRHPEVPLVVTGADPGTADTAAVIADRDLLLRGLTALPPGSGPCTCCDLSESQTATMLGCSVGTVKSQTARGAGATARHYE
jgi:DNA-directed RNA polymerase specialized sigma24 family protein